jgi:hypothetical protein
VAQPPPLEEEIMNQHVGHILALHLSSSIMVSTTTKTTVPIRKSTVLYGRWWWWRIDTGSHNISWVGSWNSQVMCAPVWWYNNDYHLEWYTIIIIIIITITHAAVVWSFVWHSTNVVANYLPTSHRPFVATTHDWIFTDGSIHIDTIQRSADER